MSNPSNNPQPTYIPSKVVQTEYPLIDNDPHFKRVCRYARPADYALGVGTVIFAPGLFWLMERVSPSGAGRGAFNKGLRLATVVGLFGGFSLFYTQSSLRFYGMKENQREIDMDMREMVAKVKAGEPLYGETRLSPHMQGVAARQSRYSALFMHVLPWFNFVNHNQHGVDTAKYYRQAELELEAERQGKSTN
ncbi:21 kDa subunit of NADH dehydrogenase [Xylariomycetidae sp. FL2044]|nr:21 kDa subunit of NADH dehydrogenase [Xylariomycetidae sp. FL2044]